MPEYSLLGDRTWELQIMIKDDDLANAGERSEAALPGLASGRLNRRSFLVGSAAGLGAAGLAGCVSSDDMMRAEAAKLYGPVPNDKFAIPAVDISKVDPKYLRHKVRYDTKEAPGTIIIDPTKFHLTASKATERPPAMAPMSAAPASCGAATSMSGARPNGRPGRRPGDDQAPAEARKSAGGMPGGLENPLGARMLYLYKNGAYTVYTIYAPATPTRSGRASRAAAPASSPGHDRPV